MKKTILVVLLILGSSSVYAQSENSTNIQNAELRKIPEVRKVDVKVREVRKVDVKVREVRKVDVKVREVRKVDVEIPEMRKVDVIIPETREAEKEKV